jgi:hypothetical protein
MIEHKTTHSHLKQLDMSLKIQMFWNKSLLKQDVCKRKGECVQAHTNTRDDEIPFINATLFNNIKHQVSRFSIDFAVGTLI